MIEPRPFTLPVHYERSDGVLRCVHTIPVSPNSCRAAATSTPWAVPAARAD